MLDSLEQHGNEEHRGTYAALKGVFLFGVAAGRRTSLTERQKKNIIKKGRQKMDQKRQEYIRGLCMMDDLLMSVVLQNKECARLVLRIILEDPGLEVEEVHTQETVSSLYGRAIRMDVKAVASDKRLCNVEVQRSDAGAVPKRARYNGSLLDANTALPGDAYGKLPEQYVILITADDVLKGGLAIYHIEKMILETGVLFGDGSHIIYVARAEKSA